MRHRGRSVPGRPSSLRDSSLEGSSTGAEGSRGKGSRRFNLALAIRPALLRDVLSRLLETVPQLHVAGYGEDEDQIRKVLSMVRPQVLLFDYEAMGPNGESIISRLHRTAPAVRILVIARRSSEENVEQVLHAGASGLVGKHEEFTTLVRAIQVVASGELWANRRTAARALEQLTDLSARVPRLEGLTKRELEIADGVALGLRNREIAKQLNISEATVKSHLNAIFRRLKIEGRLALAMLAQERNQPKN
jgi:DNA-binding NarL/FixJ family response regulator